MSTSSLVIEPVVAKLNVKPSSGGGKGMGETLPVLPPLPREEDLFIPSRSREVTKKLDLRLTVRILMSKMPKEGETIVEVDKMAEELEITKDKMYIVCNVLEGLRLMKMKGRNVYEWQGRDMLFPSMMMLKKMAEKKGMMGQVLHAKRSLAKKRTDDKSAGTSQSSDEIGKCNVVMTSQKVMMMFLVVGVDTVSLEEASILIHGPNLTDIKRKVSIRRLLDICRVLSGVGILTEVSKKDHVSDGVSFRYIGPEVPCITVVESINDKEGEKVIEEVTGEMMEEIQAVENILVG